MKALTSIAALVLFAQLTQAKDRYLITFKSQQGQRAMAQVLNQESMGSKIHFKKSLNQIQSVIVESANIQEIERLKLHPEVATVEAEIFRPIPKPVNGFKISRVKNLEMGQRIQQDTGIAQDAGDAGQAAATPVFQVGDGTPWGILAVKAGEAWALSQAGAKSRVLVLDTGIDADHPSIKANFEQGQNFIEDDNGVLNPVKFQDEEGHGTHCSGTILGVYNEKNGFTGVAPKAKLLMGKVCGTQGCSNIAVAEGIDWGIQQKVDVISMSLGGPVGSSSEGMAVANAEKAGIVVVAASGNSAADPTYSYNKKDPKCVSTNPFQPANCGVSFPAAFPTVTAVGAIDGTLSKTNFSQWGPELSVTAPGAAVISSVPRGTGRDSLVEIKIDGAAKRIKSAAFSGTEVFLKPLTSNIVAVPGVGKPEDFAKVNVAGKYALVSRGEIKFGDKVKNAIDAKAVGVLIYNNTAGLMQGALSEGTGPLLNKPVVMIEQAEGLALVDLLSKGSSVAASISTVITDYASFDGTSMATPHVAGVVALIRSANKNLTPAQVRQILKSTAMALSPNDTNQFGAGLVQADKAVQAAVGQ